MTSDVEFKDEEFSFKQDKVVYHVHTEVGNGFARVVVTELREQEPIDDEGSD